MKRMRLWIRDRGNDGLLAESIRNLPAKWDQVSEAARCDYLMDESEKFVADYLDFGAEVIEED